jgi:glutathione peroxidase
MGIVAFLSDKLSRARNYGTAKGSIYDQSFKTLAGKTVDISNYKDKNLLIVNTASKCGYTYQYEELQQLHEQYGNDVVVLGFPANNFLWQEPGDNKSIEEFCQVNYGVTFPISEKTSVKGADVHPVFKWLAAKTGRAPSWNFCKYLITNKGSDVQFFSSTVSPLDEKIVRAIRN